MGKTSQGVTTSVLGCALFLVPGNVGAAEPTLLAVSAGAFDCYKQVNPAAELGLQWRGSGRLWRLGPMAGAMATTDGAFNAYLGMSLDVPLGEHLALRASVAPGAYAKGRGKELHSVFQIRSGIEAAWRFGTRLRVGVELYHLSNADLTEVNPGEESLVLTVAVPLSRSTASRASGPSSSEP